MKVVPFAVIAAVLLSACASTNPAGQAANTAPVASGSGSSANTGSAGNAALNPVQPVAQVDAAGAEAAAFASVNGKSVFFDFDQSAIKDEYKGVVEAHAAYLGKYKGNVLVQGNTDVRGSREYNLALGQRRAESVKQALEVLGVKPQQVEAVSLGMEKPRATGSSEADHAQNRRADFVYQ
ncbi:MAG: OmpA family protein [Vogesella sp.]|uniref:OmpA family protein n=1 Tax=Vogesella sp. TaxID=1904252 RepID=UPI00391DB9E6